MTTAACITTAGRAAVLAGLFLLSAGPAAACTVLVDRWNDPISFSGDGSFVNADEKPGELGRDALSGKAVVDLGAGMVSQVVNVRTGCNVVEHLVVTSCFEGTAIAMTGKLPTGRKEDLIAGASAALVQEILWPRGKIRVDVHATIQSLTAAAEVNDVQYVVKGSEGVQWAPWQHYPMRRSCSLFYPGSPGSK